MYTHIHAPRTQLCLTPLVGLLKVMEFLRNNRWPGDLVVAQVAGPDVDLDPGVGRRVSAGEVDALRYRAAAAGDVKLLRPLATIHLTHSTPPTVTGHREGDSHSRTCRTARHQAG